jgi:hypothetical protein
VKEKSFSFLFGLLLWPEQKKTNKQNFSPWPDDKASQREKKD